jgi:peptidoglycan hydrolase-like protein with peptidoglycan-binding domain
MAEKGTRALLLEVIQKEIGVIEGPKDNETKYGAYTKANFLPWCGSFVMWSANQAGVKVPNTVYTPAGVAAFKKANKWVPVKGNKPQPGWVVYFDFPGGRDIDHVGWVLKDNGDGTAWCIEGNTSADGKKGSQSNGGECAKKLRAYGPNKKNLPVFIAGYGAVDYPDAVSEPIKTLEEKKVELAAVAKSQGAEVPPVKLFTPIKKGAKGQSVKNIQALLKIGSDGEFGPGTEKAVKNFQKKEKLPTTGIVDEETFRRLKGVK